MADQKQIKIRIPNMKRTNIWELWRSLDSYLPIYWCIGGLIKVIKKTKSHLTSVGLRSHNKYHLEKFPFGSLKKKMRKMKKKKRIKEFVRNQSSDIAFISTLIIRWSINSLMCIIHIQWSIRYDSNSCFCCFKYGKDSDNNRKKWPKIFQICTTWIYQIV